MNSVKNTYSPNRHDRTQNTRSYHIMKPKLLPNVFGLRTILKLLLITFCVLISGCMVSPCIAQDLSDCTILYYDRNGDGQPDGAKIQCPYAGSTEDVAFVFEHTSEQIDRNQSGEILDFQNEAWVFDAQGDDRAELAIDFYTEGKWLVADLYDDQNRDGSVTYEITADKVFIREGETPTVRVETTEQWWSRDTTTNHNLHILVDGPVRALFGFFDSEWAEENLPIDGIFNFEIWVHDTDADGRPDYEMRQSRLSEPGIKTELIVSTQDNEYLAPEEEMIFWPYLGLPADYIKPYNGAHPPIQIDWDNAQITAVGEFVATRSQESNWFIYSQSPFGEDNQTYANFENPFAFYDLAADQDGYPELIVRSEYTGPNDPLFLEGLFPQPMMAIRYSWEFGDDIAWDYSLSLFGRHPITQEVSFPGFSVNTIPYQEYPDWVINNQWDSATFVATESAGYSASEGIYGGFSRILRDFYLTGFITDPTYHIEELRDVPEGYRHEYNPELQDNVQLYISSIDHKVHLLNAIEGIWNIDDMRWIEYHDLDKDGYVDTWYLFNGETRQAALIILEGFALYESDGEVKIRQAETMDSIFQAAPPENQANWRAWRQHLEEYPPLSPSDDLEVIFEQFTYPQDRLSNVALRDVRITDTGFRYVMDVSTPLDLRDALFSQTDDTLQAGSYLVTVDDESTFTFRHLTPAQLNITQVALRSSHPTELKTTQVLAEIQNTGLEDAKSVRIEFFATPATSAIMYPIDIVTTTVASGESRTVFAEWEPLTSEHWIIKAQISEPVETSSYVIGPLASKELEVQVFRPYQLTSMELLAFDKNPIAWTVGMILIAIAMLALIIFRSLVKSS